MAVPEPVKYGDHERAPLGACCELCGSDKTRPVADHCHKHGWVRGAICQPCNARMGCIDRLATPRVDSAVLAALVAYWHRCPECFGLNVADLAPVPSSRVTVDLSDDLYERLRLAAFTERCSVSEAVRKHLMSSFPELARHSAVRAAVA